MIKMIPTDSTKPQKYRMMQNKWLHPLILGISSLKRPFGLCFHNNGMFIFEKVNVSSSIFWSPKGKEKSPLFKIKFEQCSRVDITFEITKIEKDVLSGITIAARRWKYSDFIFDSKLNQMTNETTEDVLSDKNHYISKFNFKQNYVFEISWRLLGQHYKEGK